MLFLLYASISSRYLKIIRPLRANRGSYSAIGGIDLKEGIFALLALFALISIAAAECGNDCIIYREENNLTFIISQTVQGTGFFTTYKYAHMPGESGTEGSLFNGVEGKNQAHASGSIDTESLLSASSSYTNETDLNKAYNEIDYPDGFDEYWSSSVELKENNKLTYSPIAMAIGTRYYNLHPIAFNSLIGVETWIKNRDGFNSIDNRIEKAHGLDETLEAISASDYTPSTLTTMKVEDNLIEGKAHFGVLQLAGIPKGEESEEESEEGALDMSPIKAWQKPLTVIDQDFVGTYQIKNNATLAISSSIEHVDDDWLPCCFGGYLTMPTYYKKGPKGFGSNVNSIFDCTCWRQPGECVITPVQY